MMQFILSHKLIALFFVGVIIFVLVALALTIGQRGGNQSPAQLNRQPAQQPLTLGITNITPLAVRDLTWLNDKEIAFSYVSDNNLNRTIGVYGDNTITPLFSAAVFPFDQVIWSPKNDALLVSFESPYNLGILKSNGQFQKLPVSGIAPSWSITGTDIFYVDVTNQPTGKLLSIRDNKTRTILQNIPGDILDSQWLTVDKLLFQTMDFESGAGRLSTFAVGSRAAAQLQTQNASRIVLSPSKTKIAYVSAPGIYVYDLNGTEQLVYPKVALPEYLFYTFVSDNELLVADANESPARFIRINIQTKSQLPVSMTILFQTKQRLELRLSPTKKILAVASDKDGLWYLPF